MLQEINLFWQSITSFQFKNLLNIEYYISNVEIYNYWHFLILVALIIILIAVIIKTIISIKYKDHLIYNKFAGKIFTWLTVSSIVFAILVLLTTASTKLFSLRITYYILLLVFLIWLVFILKWKTTGFNQELSEYHQKERINKYLPNKKK